jgi:adenine-specific DNA-methyltransferase
MQKLELTWIGKGNEPSVEPRILLHDSSKDYGDPASENMLIHGDNLLALKALEQEYAGRVKCIYIDPPYNTGSAFEHYDDNLKHSIYLQLMHSRFLLLKQLLSDDGFFCCQIDDSEGHYIKTILDEVFGRSNYLATLYIQVRYPNKTLAEDSDYQKIIEQVHIYAKQKCFAKLNRPQTEYGIEKFKWKIIEKEAGETIVLGGKNVTILKPHQYAIVEIEPCLEGLKETWATGSLARVRASAGEFFELYLSARKDKDGLGCLYKVSGIGEDSLGHRYISGPKKASANKGKFYSGIPLKRLEELKTGKSFKDIPVSNFYDFAGSFGNCRLEGRVDFKGGKKPEALIQMILQYFSNPGDLVLDSFLGSGTTAAVAYKMGRRYIGIELGEHCYTHCLPRLKAIVDGEQGGISRAVNWQGGGGFKFYELAPTLIVTDKHGNPVISDKYNAEMLVAAVAKLHGFAYAPNAETYWKQGRSQDNSYIYVTTQYLSARELDDIARDLPEYERLMICAPAFDVGLGKRYENIQVRKIPQSVLTKCEYGADNYNLNIVNPPELDEEEWEDA